MLIRHNKRKIAMTAHIIRNHQSSIFQQHIAQARAMFTANRAVQWLLLVCLSIALTGCGFHLRGNIPLSEEIKNMFVEAPDGTFKDKLEDILTNAGAQMSPSRDAADVVLVVKRADSSRSVGTLDERGLANSYDLAFKVTYQLLSTEGDVIRPNNRVRERRRFNFDPSLVVETETEERELQEDMEQDVALKIVRQLSTVTSREPISAAQKANADAADEGAAQDQE